MKALFAVTLLMFSTASLADGDAAAGKAKSATCAACHGANGVSQIPNYPNLAGQKAAYLVAQLQAFKSGERKGASSAIMTPMAAGLSEQDMKDLAAFYAEMDAAK
jgi:cytochrome c553